MEWGRWIFWGLVALVAWWLYRRWARHRADPRGALQRSSRQATLPAAIGRLPTSIIADLGSAPFPSPHSGCGCGG
jgi:hypothetical protein